MMFCFLIAMATTGIYTALHTLARSDALPICDDCATVVAFTLNPSTGEKAFYGEYLVNAQGEDVVACSRTPQNLTRRGKEMNNSRMPAMEEEIGRAHV